MRSESSSKPPVFRRVLAAFVCAVFAATNVAWANRSDPTLWEARRRPADAPALASLPLTPVVPISSSVVDLSTSLSRRHSPQADAAASLPHTAGTVRRIIPSNGTERRVVIHIQDIHRNLEAQRNIRAAIESLANDKRIGVVALEGAFGPIDVSAARAFPKQAAIREAADFLLKDGKISGAVAAAILNSAVPPTTGVDDAEHYRANVAAYRAAARLQAAEKEKLRRRELALAARAKDFNPDLRRIDQAIRSYRDGQMPLAAYAQNLADSGVGVPTSVFRFIDVSRLEARIDFDAAARERDALVRDLVARRTDETALVSAALAFRSGRVSAADFYGELRRLCNASG
ncbi:MAG: hypothetical protein JO102_06500, partial [Elusimicrobia bacterium]|nr:hypothetical protein [Elusimicrobiota bacterium]